VSVEQTSLPVKLAAEQNSALQYFFTEQPNQKLTLVLTLALTRP